MSRRRKKPARRVSEAAPAYAPNPARNLLLDTNAWIWWFSNDRRLGPRCRLAIQSAQQVFFSAASAWEIVIKSQRGKLELARGLDLPAELSADGFLPLAIEVEHALGVSRLPAIHRDPFDRMLVSQAIAENLTVVTADTALARYPVPVIDAST